MEIRQKVMSSMLVDIGFSQWSADIVSCMSVSGRRDLVKEYLLDQYLSLLHNYIY